MPRLHRLLLALAALALVSCGWKATERSDPLAVRVGCDFDNPPFAALGPTSQPVGRDVEMMEALAEEAGFHIVWVRLPFAELLGAVESGLVDCACATLGVTEERARRVAFSQPYYETNLLALVRKGDSEPKKLADLAGRKVAASPGTTAEAALRSRLPEAIAAPAPTTGDDKKTADLRLLSNDVDAAVMDGPDALDFARASGGRLVVLEEPVAVEHYAIAIGKGNEDLRARIDKALQELRVRGDLVKLDEKHGLPPSAGATTSGERAAPATPPTDVDR